MKRKLICVLLAAVLVLSVFALPASADESPEVNESEVYTFLTQEMGLNTAAACGIMANIYYETGFRANIKVGQYYGLFMYYGPLANALKTWCSENDQDYTTVHGQMLYLQAMCEGTAARYNYTELYATLLSDIENTASGAYTAASLFCKKFEKPANQSYEANKRGNYASGTLFEKYQDDVPAAEATVTDTAAETAAQTTTEETAPLYTETAVTYTGYVTASALNVRSGPGTSFKATSIVYDGAKLSVIAEAQDSAGTVWCKISNSGWCCKTYVSGSAPVTETAAAEETETADTAAAVSGGYTVTASSLNVRLGPGLKYETVDCLHKGDSVEVLEKSTDTYGTVWCRIADDKWVAKTYLSGNDGDDYCVTASALNVRSGAGTDYEVLSCLYNGQTVVILELDYDVQGNLWGQMSDGNWISMTYVTEI